VVHVAAEPHPEESVVDNSPAHRIQEKRAASANTFEPVATPDALPEAEVPVEGETADAATRWGRPDR
jgi:hypothetical protein